MHALPSALLLGLAGFSLALTVSAQSAQLTPQATAPMAAPEAIPAAPPTLVGPVTREQVEAAVPKWKLEEAKATPEPAAVAALGKVAPGASITIYLGTWCGDSRRELSRFWRALDDLGSPLPATVELIGVDETKQEPKDRVSADGIEYVPTFIVRRDGKEVGRIVESSPRNVEVDLYFLLAGQSHGVLSLRPDVGAENLKP